MGATSNRPDGSSSKWKSVWNDIVPRKVNIFAWKLSRDALATQVNLCERKMEKTRICQVCGAEEDDSFHAMVHCPNARGIWQAMRPHWDIPDPRRLRNTGPGWLLHAILPMEKTKAAMLLVMFWCIWHVHNDITHDKILAPVEASRHFLCSYMDSLLLNKQYPCVDAVKGKQICSYSARSKLNRRDHDQPRAVQAQWKPPAPDSVKLNVDGSFSPDDGSAGIGLVLRNHKGEVLFSACCSLSRCIDALDTELGLHAAIGWTDKIIVLESGLCRSTGDGGSQRFGQVAFRLVCEGDPPLARCAASYCVQS